MNDQQVLRWKQTLGKYVPPESLQRLFLFLTDTNQVQLRVSSSRSSKLGDYRSPQRGHEYHEISVNGDLNSYFFLWVLLHEMAHLDTWKQYHHSVQPHGHEWQQAYCTLLQQYADCFPQDVRPLLNRYVRRIPLSHKQQLQIEEALRHYDSNYQHSLQLNELPEGSTFRILTKPDLLFRSISKRRTRWLCQEVASRRQYLVNGNAPVELIAE